MLQLQLPVVPTKAVPTKRSVCLHFEALWSARCFLYRCTCWLSRLLIVSTCFHNKLAREQDVFSHCPWAFLLPSSLLHTLVAMLAPILALFAESTSHHPSHRSKFESSWGVQNLFISKRKKYRHFLRISKQGGRTVFKDDCQPQQVMAEYSMNRRLRKKWCIAAVALANDANGHVDVLWLSVQARTCRKSWSKKSCARCPTVATGDKEIHVFYVHWCTLYDHIWSTHVYLCAQMYTNVYICIHTVCIHMCDLWLMYTTLPLNNWAASVLTTYIAGVSSWLSWAGPYWACLTSFGAPPEAIAASGLGMDVSWWL